jgi:SAM-dependent methyltransferase
MERMLEATAAAEDRHFWFRGLRMNARFVLDQALGGERDGLIIDCGAGTGRNLDWLKTFGPAVGVERSPTGLRVAREHGRRVIAGSVTHLPFPSAVARVVTSFDVLYCLDDIAENQAIREMFRVLSPGGVAIVNVAALEMLKGSHSTLTHEQRRYTTDRLRGLLEQTGFRIERLTYVNMITLPLVLAVRLGERLTGRAGTASDADLRVPTAPVNETLAGLLSIENALLRAVNLPIGSSVLAVARKPG